MSLKFPLELPNIAIYSLSTSCRLLISFLLIFGNCGICFFAISPKSIYGLSMASENTSACELACALPFQISGTAVAGVNPSDIFVPCFFILPMSIIDTLPSSEIIMFSNFVSIFAYPASFSALNIITFCKATDNAFPFSFGSIENRLFLVLLPYIFSGDLPKIALFPSLPSAFGITSSFAWP